MTIQRTMKNMRTLLTALMMGLLSMLVACGGGGDGEGGSGVEPPPAPPALVSIQITPAVSSKAEGLVQPYQAIGTFEGGGTQDISALVSWKSSDAAKASISAEGIAATLATGTTSITAALDGVTSNTAALTVTDAALVSILVTPATSSISAGFTQQYKAVGTFTDGSTPDITASVSWGSSDTALATISAGGLATGMSEGSPDITASMAGVESAPVGLTVVQATWHTTGALQEARYNHTATLLPDGRVLVAGGLGAGDVALTSSEIFDPATGTWTSTGSLNGARYGHTATLLQNGKVLVTGGSVDASGSLARSDILGLTSSEIFDPATGLWTLAAPMQQARYYHSATLLPDGKVLVAGGRDAGNLATSEVFDPATGLWTAAGVMKRAISLQTATLLADGKVLVAGGGSLGGSWPSSTLGFFISQFFDPSTGVWTATAGQMYSGRSYHTATMLASGKVLAAGGGGFRTQTELFDPAIGSWALTGEMQAGRFVHTSTLLPNGKVLVAGGRSSFGELASSELYDPTSGTWTLVGALQAARAHHTATLLPDGRVLVAGGLQGTSVLSSSEVCE